MEITTKTFYQEAYIPPRCRKERYRETVKTIITTVPEAHYEDAPVALRRQGCLRADAADADGKHPSGITNPMQTRGSNEMWADYRLYRGRLYCRAMMYNFCVGGKGPYTMEEFVKHYARNLFYSARPMFHLSGDLRRFKELTSGGTIIMGRKTLESFPNGKPLPNRRNIVISKNCSFVKRWRGGGSQHRRSLGCRQR